jgi:arabinoxylan arabinofuranohydrolase
MTRLLIVNFIILLVLTNRLIGQNPISPPGIYVADPAAHVFNDGRIYVYGAIDKYLDYKCSHSNHVLSSDNMIDWTLHEDHFRSKAPNDKVPYSDDLLFSPDAVYKDGKYYLYYCIKNRKQSQGVAMSNHPVDGFSAGEPLNLHGYNQIDPAAFVDDDGTSYYMWGQFSLKMAKLNDDMTSIDAASIIPNVITEADHQFHEGGFMIKRNGVYYLIYAHLDEAHRPTQLGYATSTKPMGPYKYGGVIIDNDHSDPFVWNNQGSIAKFKDQWYVFYHRPTHGTVRMRKACVEPIYFREDGSIPEVMMTTQGAGPPLNPLKELDAARACVLHGNVRIEASGPSNEVLTKIENGDRALYRYLQFTGEEKKVMIRVKVKGSGSTIILTQDGPWNSPIAVVAADGNENSEWQMYSADVKASKGKHGLWLNFNVKQENELTIDWIKFD